MGKAGLNFNTTLGFCKARIDVKIKRNSKYWKNSGFAVLILQHKMLSLQVQEEYPTKVAGSGSSPSMSLS
eukprot:586079-Amphidinium_carterae.1